jgi:hypothetical protein
MSANLQELREAITTAKEDRDECLRFLRGIILKTWHTPTIELFAKLEGDVHELDLLRKRELSLLVDGKEPELLQETTEGTEIPNQGGTEA